MEHPLTPLLAPALPLRNQPLEHHLVAVTSLALGLEDFFLPHIALPLDEPDSVQRLAHYPRDGHRPNPRSGDVREEGRFGAPVQCRGGERLARYRGARTTARGRGDGARGDGHGAVTVTVRGVVAEGVCWWGRGSCWRRLSHAAGSSASASHPAVLSP